MANWSQKVQFLANQSKLFNDSSSNHSSTSLDLPLYSLIALTTTTASFAVLGTFGNVMILLTILRNSSLQTTTDLFICSLAFADLIVTSTRQPLMIFDLYHIERIVNRDADSNNVFRLIGYVSTPASLACMFAVTIDRFIAIKRPLQYSMIMTKKRAMFIIIVCWVLAVLAAVALHFMLDAARYFLWGTIVLCLIATTSIYVYLFFIAKQHQIKIDNTNNNSDDQNDRKKERKAAKTTALIVGVFTAFYTPFLIVPIVMNPKEKDFYHGFIWVHSLCLWNSSVNPYIYCARNDRYSSAFKSLLGIKNKDNEATRNQSHKPNSMNDT